MAATIMDVRRRPLNDITTPYLFSDVDIQQALDEAAATLELRGIGVDSVLGAKAQRLMASKDLISDYVNRINGRAVAAVSEGSNSVTFADLLSQRSIIEQDLRQVLEQLGGCPLEVSYDC